MKPTSSSNNQKGIVLVGAVALMIFLGIFGAIGTSMLGSSAGSHQQTIQGSQALAIAAGGVEWYMEQLEGDTNWTNQTTQTRNFAEGQFTITIGSMTDREVRFTSTGQVTSLLNDANLRRTMTVTALKLPHAFQFALFYGHDPASLTIRSNGGNHSIIRGDVWGRDSVQVNNNNQVLGGKVYVPTAESVSGGGTYTAKEIANPVPTMPVITTTFYTDLMDDYDDKLDNNNSNVNRTLNNTTFDINTSADCSGGICEFRDFTTRGNTTIKGNGFIVANRNMNLHSEAPATIPTNVTLTITPDVGGQITFIVQNALNICRSRADVGPTITANPNVRFYSRTNDVLVFETKTTLNDAMLFSRRQIRVEDGADITGDSLLFAGAGGAGNLRIRLNGDAAVTSVDGSLISLGTSNDTIEILNGGGAKTNVRMNGLVYARASATQGGCEITDATISGSVVCVRFQGNQVTNAAITYDPDDFPADPPPGFEAFVSKKADSWSVL